MSLDQRGNEAVGLAVGDATPDLSLVDDQGTMVTLSDLWRKRPLVLLFVRHFG